MIGMQQTRRHILEILRDRGEATVDEIVVALRERIEHNMTAVTIRHHLDILRGENLVSAPAVRRSGTPGRPRYVYSLTDDALMNFPNNYQYLMGTLLDQIKTQYGAPGVNVILEGVADKMVADSHLASLHELPLEDRLTQVVDYLNDHGYEACWEPHPEGYLLFMHNCPYRKVASDHRELCGMDMRLISGLIGMVPRNKGRMADDDDRCAYLIPSPKRDRATA